MESHLGGKLGDLGRCVSKEVKRMLCLGDVWLQGFGFLAQGRLAAGWKGLAALKNKQAR